MDQSPDHNPDSHDEGTEPRPWLNPDRSAGEAESEPELGSLFEQYNPRSVEEIVSDTNALRDSEAAHAAAVILDGVEAPHFDQSNQEFVPRREFEPCESNNKHRWTKQKNDSAQYQTVRVERYRSQKSGRLSWTITPGAQFVYALLILTTLSGLIGLAASMQTPALILIAGIASPILLPICIWKWVRWLDSTPYYYRLMTSLGEDARNLMTSRLFFWVRLGRSSKS